MPLSKWSCGGSFMVKVRYFGHVGLGLKFQCGEGAVKRPLVEVALPLSDAILCEDFNGERIFEIGQDLW